MKRLLLLLTCATLHAGDGTPRFYKVTVETVSPSRDILVEHYRSNDASISPVTEQIWLVSTKDPGKRRLLFTHERIADVLFSDDEKWLVINNHCLSDESRLLLFKRKGPLVYKQVADLTDAAWAFFSKKQGLPGSVGFDHSYVSAVEWAGDKPPTLLLRLQGHADSRNYTKDWYCLYDVESKSFSTDLDAKNKSTTAIE